MNSNANPKYKIAYPTMRVAVTAKNATNKGDIGAEGGCGETGRVQYGHAESTPSNVLPQTRQTCCVIGVSLTNLGTVQRWVWQRPNCHESLRVRSTIKAGGVSVNHNETQQRATGQPAVSMRRELLTTTRRADRLELLVVRAGLRAGRSARGRARK